MEKKVMGFFIVSTILTVIAVFSMQSAIEQPIETVYSNRMDFDSNIWKQLHNSHDRDNQRGLMADDLKKKLLSTPLNKQQVIAMLGPADQESSEIYLSYKMGMWSQNRSKMDSINILFGADGQISDVFYRRH
ncbi:MAG: hypothetical protein OEZ58_21370 [Gammaproteobacteria bacterium]|nr:hypothetical protein [Gammaproteobacteria bacterium]MDH5731543.1 hypothetical protein [Gammaproteobacteria bacterium]